MSEIDQAIEVLLRKHKGCDDRCPELWLVTQLKKARTTLQQVLSNRCVMSTTDVKSLAKELSIEV